MMKHSYEFERAFTRISADLKAVVRTKYGQRRYDHPRDISMKGIYLFTGDVIAEGTECDLRLSIGENDDSLTIEVQGRVTRCEEEGFAIEFTGLSPEAYNHLRLLVLYNSPDSQKAEQEINARLGIRDRKQPV